MHRTSYPLYVGSTSRSRHMLLQDAGIPFEVIAQSADEQQCDWSLPLNQTVEGIARYKMKHLVLPAGAEGDYCFVLTADTLTENRDGGLEGKPIDRADAVAKLIRAREGVRTGTACLVRKCHFVQGSWQVIEERMLYAQGSYIFNVPDAWIDFYLDNVPVLGSGAIAIEGFGNQFLQSLQGSLSAVIGLPMYELREALQTMGFFLI